MVAWKDHSLRHRGAKKRKPVLLLVQPWKLFSIGLGTAAVERKGVLLVWESSYRRLVGVFEVRWLMALQCWRAKHSSGTGRVRTDRKRGTRHISVGNLPWTRYGWIQWLSEAVSQPKSVLVRYSFEHRNVTSPLKHCILQESGDTEATREEDQHVLEKVLWSTHHYPDSSQFDCTLFN